MTMSVCRPLLIVFVIFVREQTRLDMSAVPQRIIPGWKSSVVAIARNVALTTGGSRS